MVNNGKKGHPGHREGHCRVGYRTALAYILADDKHPCRERVFYASPQVSKDAKQVLHDIIRVLYCLIRFL